MRVSRHPVGAALVVVGSLGLLTSAFGRSPAVAAEVAAPGTAYAGVASADGLRVTYEVKGFIVTDRLVDGGAPVAQVSVSSLESVGFASAPYPGEAAASAPGLVSGGAGVPLPDYPLIARSQHPTPEKQTVDQGVVRLSSESTPSSSKASGAAGGPDDESANVGATRAAADVVHDEASGVVTSTASTSAEVFSVAGVFRIGRVASTAKVVDTPDGDPTREVSLHIGEMTIAGQTVALTDRGLVMPGTSTPLPDASPLREALVDQGIDVRYLAAEDMPDGVVAPGVEVRVTHPVPNAPSPGVVVYRFGRASASAKGGVGSLTVDATVAAFPDDGGAPSPQPTSASLTAPTPIAGGGPAANATDAAEGVTAIQPLAAASPQWDRSWTMAFYLLIVLSGVAAVGGAQLIRVVGVRMPWTS